MIHENIIWHLSAIDKAKRQSANGHKSGVIWFTGLSASGKSTLAVELEKHLFNRKIKTYVLDGDNIRHGLCQDLSFSALDRQENIRRISEVAKLFVDAGLLVITAFISPYREDRRMAKSLFGDDEFIEVYIKCNIATCEDRDPKNLYKKAKNGEVQNFTGISAPYEEPEQPDLILETDQDNIAKCIEKLLSFLEERQYLKLP